MSGASSGTTKEAGAAGAFAFTAENLEKAKAIIARYPEGRQRSAVLPLLDLAQRQCGGWLPEPALRYIGDFLKIPHMAVMEVATFYSMFNLKPVGRNFVQVCTTTPCWLRGSDGVVAACRKELGIGVNETTADGEFTVAEVECLGACVNAPVVQINDDYYEDLDGESMGRILKALKRGETVKPGSQIERQTSAPVGGPTTLKSSDSSGG